MNTPQTLQPNTQYFNPSDGKTYLMKQVDPSGKGTVMVDSQSQEEVLLPNPSMQEVQQNNGAQSLKPIMKTQTQTLGVSMANDNDQIVNGSDAGIEHVADIAAGAPGVEAGPVVQDPLMTDIDQTIEQIDMDAQGIDGDIDNIVENEQLLNSDVNAVPTSSPDVLGMPVVEEVQPQDPAPLFPASTEMPPTVMTSSKRWADIRRTLTTRGVLDFRGRQLAHLKNAGLGHLAADLGFAPEARTPDPSGHSKQGVPLTGPPAEKNMEIGLTEFPKDQDRDSSVGLDTEKGYNIRMKDMDEKQVAEREKFDNEQRQYSTVMTIRQLRLLLDGGKNKEVSAIESGKGVQPERQPVKAETNDQYEVEKRAIALAVGLRATAIDFGRDLSKFRGAMPPDEPVGGAPVEDSPPPKDAPVVHKPTETAPKVNEYTEPGIIPAATNKMKVFLSKFSQHYTKLEELKDQLRSATMPHQQKIVEEQGKVMPAISEQEKLMKEALEMAFSEIAATAESVAHYQDELWAAVSRTKTIQPAVTIPQIIAEAKLIDQHLAEQIQKLTALVGEKGQSKLRERFLYEFPPSKSHEIRMAPEASMVVRGFMFVQSEIADALELLEH
jgi:hypothetical protein